MKGALFFLGGILFAVLIAGTIAGTWLLKAPSTRDSAPIDVGASSVNRSAPARVTMRSNFPLAKPAEGNAGGLKVFLQGRVIMPPALRKIIDRKPDGVLTIRAFVNAPGGRGRNLIPAGSDHLDTTFPFHFKFELAPAKIMPFAKNESFSLLLRAVYCFDRAGESCRQGTFPNLEGSVRVQVKVAGGLRDNMEINVPTVVLNKLQPKVDAAACSAAGGTITGTLRPTREFLEAHSRARRLVVFGMPYYDHLPPAPYSGQARGREPLSAEAMLAMKSHGIAVSPASLASQGAFRLEVPEKFRPFHYRLWAVPCQDGETDDLCLRRGFPVALGLPLGRSKGSAIALIGRGFQVGVCGMKDQEFVLHAWPANAPAASEEALHLAVPPEAIGGMSY